MARPVKIADDTILEAARALFSEKGPHATTAEIAARAGVSEGILFKRFGNKGALLTAAMTPAKIGHYIETQIREKGPLRTRKDFERFIAAQIHALRDVVPMVLMAWSSWRAGGDSAKETSESRAHTEELLHDLAGPDALPLVATRVVAAMLREEMDAGRLTKRDPEAIARILAGSTWYYVFLGTLAPNNGMSEDHFVKQLARLLHADLAISK